jgi:hypothetical protein
LADLLAEHGTLGSGGFRLPTWSTRNSSGALAEGSLAPALRASSKRWWLGWLILVVVQCNLAELLDGDSLDGTAGRAPSGEGFGPTGDG